MTTFPSRESSTKVPPRFQRVSLFRLKNHLAVRQMDTRYTSAAVSGHPRPMSLKCRGAKAKRAGARGQKPAGQLGREFENRVFRRGHGPASENEFPRGRKIGETCMSSPVRERARGCNQRHRAGVSPVRFYPFYPIIEL